MDDNFSYAVIGTGAVGGYYGALLQRSGKDVHFLLHSDYDHVCMHGLRIDSIKGDFRLPRVNSYNEPGRMPRCDVAIVALKATANSVLPQILPQVLNERGTVLLLQNGFGQEEFIAAIKGVKTIVAGLCFICTTKLGPGTISHQDYGSVILAQYTPDGNPAGVTPIMEQLGIDFTNAGITVDLHEDLIEARWRKLVWNIPFSGLTTLFDINTFQVVTSPDLEKVARNLMEEVALGAEALGRNIPEEFIGKMIGDTKKMRPYFPSMKLDYNARNVMELDALYRSPLEAAARRGRELARIDTLYHELAFLEEQNLKPVS